MAADANTVPLSKDGQLYDIPKDQVAGALKDGFEETVHLKGKDNSFYDIPKSKSDDAIKNGGFTATHPVQDGPVDNSFRSRIEKGFTTAAALVPGGAAAENIVGAVGGMGADLVRSATTHARQGLNLLTGSKEDAEATGQTAHDVITDVTQPHSAQGKELANTVSTITKPIGDLFEAIPKMFESHGHPIMANDVRSAEDLFGGEIVRAGKGVKAVASAVGDAASKVKDAVTGGKKVADEIPRDTPYAPKDFPKDHSMDVTEPTARNPNGSVAIVGPKGENVGEMHVSPSDDGKAIQQGTTNIHDPANQGKDLGTHLLQKGVDYALDQKKQFYSDTKLSKNMALTFFKLKGMGYDVQLSPKLIKDAGGAFLATSDGSPVFKVTKKLEEQPPSKMPATDKEKITAEVNKATPAEDRKQAVRAQRAGYSLPPSQTKAGGLLGKAAEMSTGSAAKGGLKEDFSIKNQKNSEKLVREETGIKGDALTKDAVKTEKRRLGANWDAAEDLKPTATTKMTNQNPNMISHETLEKADFSQRAAEIEQSVKNPIFDSALKKQFKKVQAIGVNGLTTKELAVTVKRLRDKAAELYDSSNPTDAKAARKLADLFDDVLDHHLEDTGQPKSIIENMKASRKKYAQLSEVEGAFGKDGTFDARKLADNDEGQLTGKLKDVADFARKYREYSKPVTTATGPSKTELTMHGIALATGKMTGGASAIPAAGYVASRAARKALTSESFQKGAGKAKTTEEIVQERLAKKRNKKAGVAERSAAAAAINSSQFQNE